MMQNLTREQSIQMRHQRDAMRAMKWIHPDSQIVLVPDLIILIASFLDINIYLCAIFKLFRLSNEQKKKLYRIWQERYTNKRLIVSNSMKYWIINGYKHSLNGDPSEIIYSFNRIDLHHVFGILHSENDAPAEAHYGGPLSSQFWYKDGNISRDNGLPAIIREQYATLAYEWLIAGKWSRDNGAAHIEIYDNLRQIRIKRWKLEEGEVVSEYLNGKKVKRTSFHRNSHVVKSERSYEDGVLVKQKFYNAKGRLVKKISKYVEVTKKELPNGKVLQIIAD